MTSFGLFEKNMEQSHIYLVGDKEQIDVKEPFPVTKCQFTS